MYFFFHLFTGTVLGLLIMDILHDRRWVLPCIAGSILPDLIDKPLGHLLFEDSIGFGRIFTHTLLAVLVLVVFGLILLEWGKTPVVSAIAAGVISHQVLDLMWREPKNWLYPRYGQFQGKQTADFFFVLLNRELENPSEILLALLLVAGLILFVKRASLRHAFLGHRTAWRGLAGASAILLCGCAGFIIHAGLMKHLLPGTGWTRPEEYLIGGIVMVLAGFLLWRWGRLVLESGPLFRD